VLVLKDLRQRVRLITRTWHKDSRCPGVLVSWLSGKRTLTAGKEGGDWGRKANEVAS